MNNKKTISWNEISEAHLKFKKQLEGKSFNYILAPIRGGLVTGTIMSHFLNGIPLIPVQLQTRDTDKPDTISSFDLEQNISMKMFNEFYLCKDKKILITEDIIDSGKTLFILLTHLELHYDIDITITSIIFNENLYKTIKETYTSVKEIIYYKKLENDTWYYFPWEEQNNNEEEK